MRKRPVALLACMFLIGIMLRRTGAVPVAGIGLLLFLYATPWRERGIRLVAMLVGMPLMLLLGLVGMERQEAFRDRYLSVIEDGQTVRLAGKIDNVEQKTRCFYYYLTDCSVELSGLHMPCNDVLAYVSSDDYSVGQILVLQGTISLFDEAANEGQFDARAFYRSRKIDFGVWVDEVERVEGQPDRFREWLLRIRTELGIPIDRYAGDDGVLSAMLLGDKTLLDSEIKSLYQKSGIAHILAISGLHISLLGMSLYRLLRHRCGLTYLWSGLMVSAFLVMYTIMTGDAVSARRAVGMLFVYLVADFLGCAYDMLSALGLVIIFLLWRNPFLVENIGFQFSVVAVVGICVGRDVLVPRVRNWNAYGCRKEQDDVARDDAEWNALQKLVEWMRCWAGKSLPGIMISLSIQLFTVPLVAYYYYEIPVYAILLNIPVLAVIPYVLGLAAVGSLTGQIMFLQPLSFVSCRVCGWILQAYRWLCDASLMLPGASFITGKPSETRIVVYYCLLGVLYYVLWCRMQRMGRRMQMEDRTHLNESVVEGSDIRARLKERRDKKSSRVNQEWIHGRLGFGVSIVFLLTVLFVSGKPEFELDILDVGQGDAIYLCTSDGTSLMIDGGSTDVKSVGMYRILPFLKAKAIRKVSYWFVSHTDEDHISGLIEVMESGYQIENLVFAEAQKEDEKAKQLAELAQQNGIQVCYMKAGDVLESWGIYASKKGDAPSSKLKNEKLGKNSSGQEMRGTENRNIRIECLYPTSDNDCEDVNDRCLVLYYQDENFSAFFGGDISSEVEEQLVAGGKCSKTDVLKASHHGSKYSNSDAFLQALHPRLTIASAGKKNRYGHPSPEAVERVEESGSTFYSTIDCGRIRINFDDGEMVAQPYKNIK